MSEHTFPGAPSVEGDSTGGAPALQQWPQWPAPAVNPWPAAAASVPITDAPPELANHPQTVAVTPGYTPPADDDQGATTGPADLPLPAPVDQGAGPEASGPAPTAHPPLTEDPVLDWHEVEPSALTVGMVVLFNDGPLAIQARHDDVFVMSDCTLRYFGHLATVPVAGRA